jgi:hypothetical protein
LLRSSTVLGDQFFLWNFWNSQRFPEFWNAHDLFLHWPNEKWLVGSLEPWNFMSFYSVGNVIIPTDEVIFFSWVGQPPTRWLHECSAETFLLDSRDPPEALIYRTIWCVPTIWVACVLAAQHRTVTSFTEWPINRNVDFGLHF